MRATVLLLLCACGTTSQDEECSPLSRNCAPGEKCAVDEEGTPRCYPSREGEAEEGEQCTEPSGCGPGLGCVDSFGVTACLRFCDPDREDACAIGATPGDTFSERAECIAVVGNGVGVCVRPCDLATGAGCAADPDPEAGPVRCVLPFGVPYAVCSRFPPDSEGRLPKSGAACGATAPCFEGVCVRRGEGAVCRAAAESGCADGERAFDLASSADPLAGGAPYLLCEPCALLGDVGGRWQTTCFTLQPDAVEAAQACARDDAALLRFATPEEGAEIAALAGALDPGLFTDGMPDSLGPDETGLWTAAVRTEDGWRWGEGGEPVADALFEGGAPPAGAEQAVLRLDGKLYGAGESGGAFPACTLNGGDP